MRQVLLRHDLSMTRSDLTAILVTDVQEWNNRKRHTNRRNDLLVALCDLTDQTVTNARIDAQKRHTNRRRDPLVA